MRIGLPREIKNHEYRVGLTPASVRELVHRGHEVWVQAGAGIVADSDPATEFEETLNKARGLRRAVELTEQGL